MRRVLFWILVVALLGPALMLTFTRLVEPSAGRWVRLESFTPAAMLLYAGALVLLVVAAVWKRRVWVVALAALAAVGLGLHAWWFSPMVSGANPPPAESSEPITVMTANMYVGEGDGIELVQVASEEDVDVLVVEEITAPLLSEMDRAGLETVLPYRAGDTGEESGGTMVFATLAITEAERLDTMWDSWSVTAGDVTLLAVHPHAPTDAELWRSDHEVVRDAVRAEQPDLVVGDFNATTDHPPMRALADDGWRSASELTNEGWQPTWPVDGTVEVAGVPLPHLVQIDHVLTGPTYAALSTRTVDIADSDHRAVIAEVAEK